MSRERFIDPRFFRSESVSQLSRDARLTLVGLFATADDFGRGRGSPRSVQLELFPDKDVTTDQVGGWLREIEAQGIARFYQINGSTYYDLPNWNLYQNPKYQARSKIPSFSQTPEKPGGISQVQEKPVEIRENPADLDTGLATGRGGEGRGVMTSPPTPHTGELGGTLASPPDAEDSLWLKAEELLPRFQKGIENPKAYIRKIRSDGQDPYLALPWLAKATIPTAVKLCEGPCHRPLESLARKTGSRICLDCERKAEAKRKPPVKWPADKPKSPQTKDFPTEPKKNTCTVENSNISQGEK